MRCPTRQRILSFQLSFRLSFFQTSCWSCIFHLNVFFSFFSKFSLLYHFTRAFIMSATHGRPPGWQVHLSSETRSSDAIFQFANNFTFRSFASFTGVWRNYTSVYSNVGNFGGETNLWEPVIDSVYCVYLQQFNSIESGRNSRLFRCVPFKNFVIDIFLICPSDSLLLLFLRLYGTRCGTLSIN